MLESGIDVEAAYLAAFHDEIIGRAKAETAKKTESATLEAIKSGGMRPAEIGAKNQSGIVRKSSVSELTAEDRAEIARRAARGEKIRFLIYSLLLEQEGFKMYIELLATNLGRRLMPGPVQTTELNAPGNDLSPEMKTYYDMYLIV